MILVARHDGHTREPVDVSRSCRLYNITKQSAVGSKQGIWIDRTVLRVKLMKIMLLYLLKSENSGRDLIENLRLSKDYKFFESVIL